MATIPEEKRRKALFGALYHHDGIASRGLEGSSVTIELDPRHDIEDTREYIKTIATGLDYRMASEGAMRVVLSPGIHDKAILER